tara:strand:- start:255 stop:1154 length:900 start_codon:yes stop_codon:yes gene_type:complete
MGTPSFALPALNSLFLSKNTICSVYTQNPKKSGRGKKINRSAVHIFADKNNIKVRTPQKLTTNIDATYIKKLKADLCVVAAYGLILPESVLNAPLLGCINIHASLLPRWRGAAPIQRSILAGDKETGITIMKMNKFLDSGNILSQVKTKITSKTNFSELESNLSSIGAKELMKILDQLPQKRIKEIKQEDKLATYAKKLDKIEGKIDWSKSAKFIDCQVRAFSFYPGAWTIFKSKRLKVLSGSIINQTNPKGKIVDNLFTIGCGEFSYRPEVVQLEGKKAMNVLEFLRGTELQINYTLE